MIFLITARLVSSVDTLGENEKEIRFYFLSVTPFPADCNKQSHDDIIQKGCGFASVVDSENKIHKIVNDVMIVLVVPM